MEFRIDSVGVYFLTFYNDALIAGMSFQWSSDGFYKWGFDFYSHSEEAIDAYYKSVNWYPDD
jgi:hypothetical protein